MSQSNLQEYELVHYIPLVWEGEIPKPLPECVELLPFEKQAIAKKAKSEKHKKASETAKLKKKSLLGSMGTAIASYANTAVDAVNSFSDDLFYETQAPGAGKRFKKYFPAFPREKLLGEYEMHLVTSPETIFHGRAYITSSFFSFHGERNGKYILSMFPHRVIKSIQKAVLTKPPAGIPSHYPPQFHIILGGSLGVPVCEQDGKGPVVNSMVLFTQDGMQHMFFECKFFEEMYCVLDHAWRDPNPVLLDVMTPDGRIPEAADTATPLYLKDEHLTSSLEQQKVAYRKTVEYKQFTDEQVTQQQFKRQQQQMGQESDFLQQQQSLQGSGLYPTL